MRHFTTPDEVPAQPGRRSHHHLFSCYAPTLAATEEDKEQFYDQLSSATNTVSFKHQLFILGDFNARVGKDFKVWNKISLAIM